MVGIYKITNQLNGKVYIGQSVNLKHRWIDHKSRARTGKQSPLYNDMRDLGFENFKFEIIEQCDKESLNDREVYWIKYYNSNNSEIGYNKNNGGNGEIYNYEEIYLKWQEGKTCKEIEKELQCGDQTITKALRKFGITEKMVKSRVMNKNAFVALSQDGKPLKIFYGMKSVSLYFTGKESCADDLSYNKIPNHRSLFGFYWDYLTEDNKPERELTDEEFLSYQRKITSLSKEEKLHLSLKQRTVERPNREKLKELIRTKSFLEIGKMYGVSDNSIRKWCDFENLPRKKTEINKISDEDWELI